jgi:hypothetical protein
MIREGNARNFGKRFFTRRSGDGVVDPLVKREMMRVSARRPRCPTGSSGGMATCCGRSMAAFPSASGTIKLRPAPRSSPPSHPIRAGGTATPTSSRCSPRTCSATGARSCRCRAPRANPSVCPPMCPGCLSREQSLGIRLRQSEHILGRPRTVHSRKFHTCSISVSWGRGAMAASTPPHTMKTLLRITYFALVYGFLSAASPAAAESPSAPYFQIVGSSDERPNEQMPRRWASTAPSPASG